jgi:hypothetical protein
MLIFSAWDLAFAANFSFSDITFSSKLLMYDFKSLTALCASLIFWSWVKQKRKEWRLDCINSLFFYFMWIWALLHKWQWIEQFCKMSR